MNPLALSICALSLSGYHVSLLVGDGRLLFAYKDFVSCSICVIRNSTHDAAKQRILRVADIPEDATLLIGTNTDTNEVWIIPAADVASVSTIRLGKRWEKYRVRVCLESTLTTPVEVDDERLKGSAKEAIEKVKESLK